MNILGILYGLLIKPLELIFEIIYVMANRVIGNPGLSIIALSIAMNFLVLPLYLKADAMQMEQAEIEKGLQKWTNHIKKTFKGDERFMILQTYYRQKNYKPTHALRGSFSLLLEIPFFIAAYHFLSHLEIIKNVPFGPIANLGAPDELIHVFGISINLLPILMTLINIVSSMIYSKDAPMKTKVQLIGMALIFLVFLYTSPSGLVFYWTLNNLFSLLKNIFMKLKNPKRVLFILFSLAGLGALCFGLIHSGFTMKKRVFIIVFGVLLQMPFVVNLLKNRKAPKTKTDKDSEDNKEIKTARTKDVGSDKLFVLAAVALALLTGILISSTLIADSTSEFISDVDNSNPLRYVLHSSLYAFGIFFVWIGIFYYLSNKGTKEIIAELMTAVCVISVVDYLFFGTKLGNISPRLQFDNVPTYSTKQMALNLLVVAICIAVVHIVYKKNKHILYSILFAGIIAMIVMGSRNMININKDYKTAAKLVKQTDELPTYTFSKNGKNVVVLMMDRMVGPYIPYLMNERPELKDQFAGFTYYPNSLSYATTTNMGTPGLYGGYEYIPEEMNKRDAESLATKQNEALKVMPVMFLDEGYDVTVCDPSYAGYKWIPDLSIYDDYPDIKSYITIGKVSGEEARQKAGEELCRNMFCYDIFKIAPVFAQVYIYDYGNYVSSKAGLNGQYRRDLLHATGTDPGFMDSYGVLEGMNEMTAVVDGDKGCFLMMSNDTPHNPCMLQEPEYEPDPVIDNSVYEAEHPIRYDWDGNGIELFDETNVMHYQADMASLIKLGDWFDKLRELGVYDNTRIIIVSDHAYNIGQRSDMMMEGGTNQYGQTVYDLETFNCTLMVKDFGSQEFTVNESFMTNADVPTLATRECIDAPTNPFTGKKIEDSAKQGEQKVSFVENWDIDTNNGNVFVPSTWFSVHDDVRNPANWKSLGYY